jgi:ethanolamine utilization protein EutN
MIAALHGGGLMLLATIVGSVTATRKADTLSGYKFLLVKPRGTSSSPRNETDEMLVAVDLLGAGVGEEVIVATGRAARIAIGKEDVPVDAAIVGIVDGSFGLD